MTHSPTMRALVAAVSLLASPALRAQSTPSVREVLNTGPDWSNGVAEPASGRFIVYTDEHSIKIYNRRSRETSQIAIKAGGGLWSAISLSRSGRRLVFTAADDGKGTHYIWAVDLDSLTGKPVSEAHRVNAVATGAVDVSPDGRQIAFSTLDRTGGKLFIMPSDGGDERLIDSTRNINTPKWSHDGKTIFYLRGQGKGPGVAKIAASGGTPDSLAPAEAVIGVSPDDRLIATVRNFRSSQATVQIVDTKGKSVAAFQFNADVGRPYAWSAADPNQILLFRHLEPATLKTVSIADGTTKNYTIKEAFPDGPRFSPNGSRLAMIGRVDAGVALVMFDTKTGRRQVLTTTPQPERAGWSWSPDGSHVAFLVTNGTTMHHELHVVDIATGRSSRLVDIGPAFRANATLYRWRSDGKAIDYITMENAVARQRTAGELHRVDLSGSSTFIRTLPPVTPGVSTDGGYRLVNDTLVVAGDDCGAPCNGTFVGVPVPRGEPVVLGTGAYWLMSMASDIGSPDGKWIAFGSVGKMDGKNKPQWAITSLDGKSSRLLGEPMGCDVWPVKWLPDSHSLIGVGAASCSDWHEDLYLLPIDGSAARRIMLPENEGYTLTPDGKGILVAADDPKLGSIVAIDLSKILSGAP